MAVLENDRREYIDAFPPQDRRHDLALFVDKLLAMWNLGREDAVGLLGCEQTDAGREYVRAFLDGRAPLVARETRNRIAGLFRISLLLFGLFRDKDVENEWLREPHAMLDDRRPMDLLLDGTRESLIRVKEYVERTAGG